MKRIRDHLPTLSARFHIAFGLASLLSTIVLLASFADVVPNRTASLRAARVELAEAMASAGSMLLRRGDVDGLGRALEFTAGRSRDLVGVDLRRANGGAVETYGEPPPGTGGKAPGAARDAAADAAAAAAAAAAADDAGASHRVTVPLLRAGRAWGELVFRFATPDSAGLLNRVRHAPFAAVGFIALAGFAAFYVYLGKVLKELDPSAAVPGRVRSALDSIAECLVVVDRRGDLVLANQAFGELSGTAPEALVGRALGSLAWVDEGAERPWTAALRDGEAVREASAAYIDGAGRQRRFIVNCSPVLDGHGDVGGVLVSMDDVTRLEEQELLLRESMEAAEEANAAKSAFLSNVSHEIRTPMTAILGFTDVLRRGAANDPAALERHLQTISSSGRHLLELINDLLDLSKIEAGSMEVEAIPTSPARVAREVVEVLGVKAREKGIALDLVIATPLPESVASDPARLRQIVTNLAGNAIKFTESGGVRVALAWDVREDSLRIGVRDSGIGMTAAQQATVFDAFAQADASIARRFGGTGLGLSISLRLAEALGGTIELTSVAGEGSTFTLVLTGLRSLSGAPASIEALEASLGEIVVAPTSGRRLARAPVLVVDDAAENRELLQLVLGGAGLDVALASDGLEGVAKVRGQDFDAVLMDIQMPGMDGYEAAGAMRAGGYAGPLVALTANAMQGFEERVLAAGFSHYETKPIDIDRLLGLLARLLGEAGESAAREAGAAGTVPVADASSIPSSLATVNAAFASIAERFLERLEDELADLRGAVLAGDASRVADRAHWLKGSGGTVGYACLGEPAAALEIAANAGDAPGMRAALALVEALHARLVVHAGDAPRRPCVTDRSGHDGALDTAAATGGDDRGGAPHDLAA